MSDDLYGALGVTPSASAEALRVAFDRIRSAHVPSSSAYVTAAQAYAILGDPRLRAEYDAGRVVGVGIGQYFQQSELAKPSPRVAPAAAQRVGRLEARWQRRMAGYRRQPASRSPARTRWPFVFLAGNASGFFLTLIGIRLALGHPIGA